MISVCFAERKCIVTKYCTSIQSVECFLFRKEHQKFWTLFLEGGSQLKYSRELCVLRFLFIVASVHEIHVRGTDRAVGFESQITKVECCFLVVSANASLERDAIFLQSAQRSCKNVAQLGFRSL